MYADLHCHSFLRPFERTNITDSPPVMSGNPCDDTSVWHIAREAGDFADLEHKLGFIGYTQSDFTQVSGNNGAMLVVSLFAVENGFFELRDSIFSSILQGLGIKHDLERFLGMIISKFNIPNIRDVQNNALPYWDVLNHSINFMVKGQTTTVDLTNCTLPDYTGVQGLGYELIKPGSSSIPAADGIKVLWSIEGGNSLWSAFHLSDTNELWDCRNFKDKAELENRIANYNPFPGSATDYRQKITPDAITNKQLDMLIPWEVCEQLVANVAHLKSLECRPFFITVGHHFYNGLVGHPASLQPLTDVNFLGMKLHLLDQRYGWNSDITNAGWCVINEMLKDPARRILVDVKHMCIKSRLSYYAFRSNHYPDVPIIFSHGAVYGASYNNGNIQRTPDRQTTFYYDEDVNLFDEDIMEITRSEGLIGIEFDQRINGVKGKHPDNIMPEMIWHNMRYIAEAAVEFMQPGQIVWDILSLGTDFDGIINPMDKGQTSGMMNSLRDFIKTCMTGYIGQPNPLRFEDNIVNIDTVLDKIFFKNIADFAAKYYV